MRRATNITEDAPVASQCVDAPDRPEVEVEEEHIPSDTTYPSSLAIMPNSENGPSSIAGPSRRTPFRPTAVSAASSFVPSPLARPGRQDPQTPAPLPPPEHRARLESLPRTPLPVTDRKGKRAITISEYAEGSYAVPDEPPSSKKKRKQQHDSFMATEPVHGDGPYGYYGGTSIQVVTALVADVQLPHPDNDLRSALQHSRPPLGKRRSISPISVYRSATDVPRGSG